MSKLLLPISTLDLSVASAGLFLIAWGTFSYLAKERLFLGEAPFAVAIGILLGPYGLGNVFGWTQPGQPEEPGGSIDQLTLGLSRIVIGIQLVLVGIQLPPGILTKEFKSLVLLLIPVMTTMWLFTTACLYLAVPGIPILVALVIASCMCATDPVLSNAIVKGAFADQYVSPRLRNIISVESGSNDGFCYPFLFLAVHLLKAPSTGKALKLWVFDTILYQVGGSILYGILIGYIGARILRFSSKRNWIDKESFLLWGVGLGLFTVGTAGMPGLDDLLACFLVGCILTNDDWYRVETEDDEIQNCLDLLLNVIFFLFVGSSIPFNSFNQPEYGITPLRLLVLAILILLFRRLPAMLMHYPVIPSVRDLREAIFVGYFGPIGAGTIFYSALVLEEFEEADGIPHHNLIKIFVKPICYALVLASIVGHSLMIPVTKAVFTYFGVERIRSEETEDTDDEGDGKEDYDEDQYSNQYEDEEEEVENGGPSKISTGGTEDGGSGRPTSYHRTNTMGSTTSSSGRAGNSELYRRPSTIRKGQNSRRNSVNPNYEADETGTIDSNEEEHHQHVPSWRHSSAHKLLGPDAIAVHRHSTILRHGGSDDGMDVVLPGGWGGVRNEGEGRRERSGSTARAGGSTIKGARKASLSTSPGQPLQQSSSQISSTSEERPLLTVDGSSGQEADSGKASGSSKTKRYGTLDQTPAPLQKAVLKAKKQAKEKAKEDGEDAEDVLEEEHQESK